MVVLRATRKVLARIQGSERDPGPSDTALGDWYVNRVVLDRQPLLLLLSSASLLAIVVPARGVKSLPVDLPSLVSRRLAQLGVSPHLRQREIEAMSVVKVGPTTDRSVLGTMVDFAKVLPMLLPSDGWVDLDLREAEVRFEETPCRASGPDSKVIWPGRKSHQLLESKWGGQANVLHQLEL